MRTRFSFASVAAGCALLAPSAASACAVCLGGSDSAVRPALNAAIFVMLGAIGSMLAGFGGFVFYLARRAKAPPPPYEDLIK